MNIGYAHKSTGDQNLVIKLDALEKSECVHTFKDKISGAKTDRGNLSLLPLPVSRHDLVNPLRNRIKKRDVVVKQA